ncbi:MAG: RhuM family protein [Burkholderiales bacterium]
MSRLFGREWSVVTKHVRNVFSEGELSQESNVQNLHIAGSDQPVRFYNLDVIISVGYRVKSSQGTRFRQWATRVLREHLVQGSLLPEAQEQILAQDDGKNRLLRAVTELSQGFALAVPYEESLRIRDDVGFFQAVRSVLAKSLAGERKTDEELDLAIRQIISRAVVSDEVADIFAAAGLKKPDISILSDEFFAEVRSMPQRNLAVELLQKLLKGEIKARGKRNVVQARSFTALLEQAIRKYQNRAIETAQVLEALIDLAKQLREAGARGERLGLSDDEQAFYDALETNDSAVKVLGDATLKTIARELVPTVRKNVTIDSKAHRISSSENPACVSRWRFCARTPSAIETVVQSLSSIYERQVLIATHGPVALDLMALNGLHRRLAHHEACFTNNHHPKIASAANLGCRRR